MPNTENIQKWVDALLSGDFVQGRGRLETISSDGVSKYCCLGVACKISGVTRTEIDIITGARIAVYGQEQNGHVLPTEVIAWLGINNHNPIIDDNDGLRTAAELNDGAGWNFQQIAAGIVKTYLSEGQNG
jgi:hypothetical protein